MGLPAISSQAQPRGALRGLHGGGGCIKNIGEKREKNAD